MTQAMIRESGCHASGHSGSNHGGSSFNALYHGGSIFYSSYLSGSGHGGSGSMLYIMMVQVSIVHIVMGMMKMGNTVTRVGREPTSLVFQASVLPFTM